jgi:predicted esterase
MWPLAVVLLLVLPCAALAQPERYELGRRLKAFEAAWEKHDNEAARERALAELPKLTKQFFAGQLGEAGRTLDLAAFAIISDARPSLTRQWAWSLYAVPETRLVDGTAKEVEVTIQPFYAVKGEPPKSLEVQLWFTNKTVVTVKPQKFPLTVKVPLPPLGDSRGLDRKLYFLVDGANELRLTTIGISQIADSKNRIAALKRTAEGWDSLTTIEQATARDRSRILTGLLAGDVPETDLPAAALLENAEAMTKTNEFFTWRTRGQFWLSVPLGGRKTVSCRVFIPRQIAKDKPVPVVFALHGAGVGANAYFEAYGAGRIVKECEDRGWVLIAPDNGLSLTPPPVSTIFEKLGERYPLDAKRVFLVGHSMGAMQALKLAESGKFAGVAVLAGGGWITKPAAFKELPMFVGVGDKDSLALEWARALRKSLSDAGAKKLTYKEYPGVEHMVIVREALPDVFAMFDKVTHNSVDK